MYKSPPRFARLSQLTDRYSLSLSTMYRLGRQDHKFPKAHRLPTGTRLWSVKELDDYFDALTAERGS
jgi:predicted DNA-binding transcriptional regulator AlpA